MNDGKRGIADRAFDALTNNDREAFATAFEDMVAVCVDEYAGDDDEDEVMAPTAEDASLASLGLSVS